MVVVEALARERATINETTNLDVILCMIAVPPGGRERVEGEPAVDGGQFLDGLQPRLLVRVVLWADVSISSGLDTKGGQLLGDLLLLLDDLLLLLL